MCPLKRDDSLVLARLRACGDGGGAFLLGLVADGVEGGLVAAAGRRVLHEGHDVGAKLHEDPEIPNFGAPGHGPRLVKGMTLAIEPMVTAGDWKVRVLDNDWTAVTIDGSLAAHYENTILITDGEPEILTTAEDL